MSDRLTAWGYAASWRLARALPEPVAAAASRAVADLATRRGGRPVETLRDNLRRVVGAQVPGPALEHLLRCAMRSYARYYLEAFRLPALRPDQRRECFRLAGAVRLAADVAAGRGAVLALPHAGNWDAAGAWVAAQGWPVVTVVERLEPAALYARFLDFRRGLGLEILPLTGGDRPPLRVLVEKLRAGYVVPLLADRDLGGSGVPVRFFGGRARMPGGPAMLALLTGAPLYTVRMWYDAEGPAGALEGPLPLPADGPRAQRVGRLTQEIADRFAAGIAAHPADWHMLQPLWDDASAGAA
ncbi:phosphatidylinositol mannoside acyltransferase [Pilimelia terevasa]|uniref:Phosphatidylinositol mannoside acyltransferase n=1 Tax=Pilimelia terevasa TaxID=53372 RepID=A0A8J3BKB4_9ACTN|nr:phosphatidylinositol mannoside acyltransferase [Pilimelia terevasa]GGK25603.1 phosphatidylinositol mannoside acyltransferase [Pilimelia terevasa]